MDSVRSNQEKAAMIKKWIDPEERVTVHFDDQRNLNAEVTGCTDQLVFLSFRRSARHASRCRTCGSKSRCPTAISNYRRIFSTIPAILLGH